MKLEFDTTNQALSHPDDLGNLLMIFSRFYNSHEGLYFYKLHDGWSLKEGETERKYLVAVMGDQIYDELEHNKVHHRVHSNGLNVVWYFDGDDVILFYKEGEEAFGIINHKDGRRHHWNVVDFNDPRNDPEYDPFGSMVRLN